MKMKQLFIIPPDVWRALDSDSVNASFADMESLGIAKMPFPEVDVRFSCGVLWHAVDGAGNPAPEGQHQIDEDYLTYEFIDDGCRDITLSGPRTKFRNSLRNWGLEKDGKVRACIDETIDFASDVRKVLIVLLATKNIVKEARVKKAAQLGIGKGRHGVITTLRIGQTVIAQGDEVGAVAGSSKRPHLRRGHVRRQHYGYEMALVKSIWIEPVFVNADAAFVECRAAYQLKGE